MRRGARGTLRRRDDPLRREAREQTSRSWLRAGWPERGLAARGCGGASGVDPRVCGEARGIAEDGVLERAETLQDTGDAFEGERYVGGADGAGEVGEVGGFAALAERSGEALGPEDEELDDDEGQAVEGRRRISVRPGGG